MGKITKYLIIGPSRSGSSLLSTALDSHPEIVCYGEVLHDKGEPRLAEHTKKKDPATFCKDADTVEKYIEQEVFSPYANKEICGCKITYPHIFTPGSRLTTRVREHLSTLKDVKILHIFRYNLLESFVSNKVAEKSNLWWAYNPVKSNDRKLHINVDELRRYCATIFDQKQKLEAICASNELIEITYEELTTNFNGTIKKALNFLGADDTIQLKPLLHKIEDKAIWDRITNYKEIVNLMMHSPYLQNIV